MGRLAQRKRERDGEGREGERGQTGKMKEREMKVGRLALRKGERDSEGREGERLSLIHI